MGRLPRVAAKWSTLVRFKRFISMINSLHCYSPQTQHSAQTSNSIYAAIVFFTHFCRLTTSFSNRLSLLHTPTVTPAKFIIRLILVRFFNEIDFVAETHSFIEVIFSLELTITKLNALYIPNKI